MSTYIDGEKFKVLPAKVLEPTKQAMNKHGCAHGCEQWVLTADHIDALQAGKVLAFDINGGEYIGFIALDMRETE